MSANVPSECQQLFVAAIDFGTTYSGFAFSLNEDYGNIMTTKWEPGSREKTPSCVLLTPEKEFKAFGKEAEEEYKDLLEDGQGADFYFFERFKMRLYQTKDLKRDTKIPDINGKECLALDVFAIVIRYLSEKLYGILQNRLPDKDFEKKDVMWIITVPAIWSDSAKQFMREAGIRGGIDSERLKLILEPEAASLYCNSQKICKTARLDGSVDWESFPTGHRYVVADLGGGTADLSVHEVLDDGNLKEIRRANGEAYGGILVDQSFQDFLECIFGEKVIRYMKENHMDKVMEVQSDFETKKRGFVPNSDTMTIIKLPLIDVKDAIASVSETTFGEIGEAVSRSYGDKVKLKKEKLLIHSDVMGTFFEEATTGIIKHIQEMRDDDELGEINTLLMVGGFSGSAYVQKRITDEIPGLRVMVPPEPDTAVLKGAVLFGHRPKSITQRRARYSYGFSVGRPFEDDSDPEELKIVRHGKEVCSYVFDKLITKGEVLKVGDTFGTLIARRIEDVTDFRERFTPILSIILRSSEKDPRYTHKDHGDCKVVGVLVIKPPRNGWPPFSLFMRGLKVGETEFTAVSIDVETNETVEGRLDFL